MNISAAAFKAECLKLMDQVARTRQPVVITKHGRPASQFGQMRGTVTIHGDIMAPTGETWNAISGQATR